MAKTVKKTNKKISTKPQTQGDELKRLIQMVAIVTVLFLAFYLITLVVTKDKDEEKTKTPATIQYDEILIGNILKQPNDEYYVLIIDTDDVYTALYTLQLDNYKDQKDSLNYYTANLANIFNAPFKADKANLDVTDIKDLKVTTSTLILVKKGKISATYEGSDAIKTHLASLIKEEEKK